MASGDDPSLLSHLEQLTARHELDLQQYLSAANLEEKLNLDFMQGKLGQTEEYAGKLDGYYDQLNSYLSDAELMDATGQDLGSLDQLTDKTGLPGDLSLNDLPDIDGLETGELEQLLSEYRSLDAEQLDQRIEQLAGKQEAVGELQKQSAALEALKSEQTAQLESLKSLQGQQLQQTNGHEKRPGHGQ